MKKFKLEIKQKEILQRNQIIIMIMIEEILLRLPIKGDIKI
jgi:hypothetical protein